METLSGVKAHTIRIWEKRYGLLTPERSTTNIRYYSDEELKKLLNVSILVKHGFKISKVSHYDLNTIQKEVLKLNSGSSKNELLLDQLMVCIVNFEDMRFEEILDEEIEKTGFESIMLKVVYPLFEKIGVLWQTGAIFPAQEHFVSNLIRHRLILEASKYDNSKSSKTILFYLKEEEQHELGLLFYNFVALQSGYRTIYLGQNIPFNDLVRLADVKNVDYIFTSFINALSKVDLETYLKRIDEQVQKKRVFISGRQVMIHQPELPRNFKVVSDSTSFRKYFGVIS